VSVLWRVRDDVLDELAVDEVKRKIGFQHPIIAMHVRRGDSVSACQPVRLVLSLCCAPVGFSVRLRLGGMCLYWVRS
jgi:hypothetical protein